MGFGWLFLGYFLTMLNVPIFGILGTLIRIGGLMLVLFALLKLRRYHRSFDITVIGTLIMVAMTIVLMIVNIDAMLYEDYLLTDKRMISDSAKTVIGYIEQGISFLFNTSLLWGIFNIARETEVKKISNNAIRNFIFICFYYFVYLLSFLPFKGVQSAQAEFALITWILYFVWILLNIMLIFSCYAKICDEDDVEMEQKPSRFKFVNQYREAAEKQNRKAREEDALYRKERMAKKEERKMRRQNRGKK